MYKKILLLPLIIGLGLSLLVFNQCQPKKDDPRPKLAVSIPPLRYFVEQIVGDSFAIVSLTPEGTLPENYEPTPFQMVELNESQLLFTIGTLGFEQQSLLKDTPHKAFPTTVTLADSIELLPYGKGNLSDSADPHIWMSTQNAKIILRHIAHTMQRTDSVHALLYAARLERALQRVDQLDARLRRQFQKLTRRSFVIVHPALGYYARDFGLSQLSLEHDGNAPSARRFLRMIDLCRHDSVRVVFSERSGDRREAQHMAEEIGARVVEIDPLNTDWEKEMQTVAQALCHE